MSKPSTQRIRNFRRKIFDLTNQELEIRNKLKQLFDKFCLDAEDDKMALRHVRQAYYQIQKYRVHKRLEEIMEFHPFFGANAMSSGMFDDDDDDGDDDIL